LIYQSNHHIQFHRIHGQVQDFRKCELRTNWVILFAFLYLWMTMLVPHNYSVQNPASLLVICMKSSNNLPDTVTSNIQIPINYKLSIQILHSEAKSNHKMKALLIQNDFNSHKSFMQDNLKTFQLSYALPLSRLGSFSL
jgi:hypothetical protein